MNTDRLARYYRWIEYAAFGPALERARFVFLDRLANAERVITLGEGDGRALAKLLSLAPRAHVDVVESSAAMVALARRRIERSSRVSFHNADARTIPVSDARYDAVMMMFFLDCFSERDAIAIIRRVATGMKPGATWLISEFAVPAAGWCRVFAKAWISVMYAFFRLTTGLQVRAIPDFERLLWDAGMVRVQAFEQMGGMIRSEMWRKPA